jgi:hypothetical protein
MIMSDPDFTPELREPNRADGQRDTSSTFLLNRTSNLV